MQEVDITEIDFEGLSLVNIANKSFNYNAVLQYNMCILWSC